MTGGYYNFETLEGLREIAIVQLQWTEERRGRGPLLRWLTRARRLLCACAAIEWAG